MKAQLFQTKRGLSRCALMKSLALVRRDAPLPHQPCANTWQTTTVVDLCGHEGEASCYSEGLPVPGPGLARTRRRRGALATSAEENLGNTRAMQTASRQKTK